MPHIAPERLPELELFKELAPQTKPELVWLLRSRSYLAHLTLSPLFLSASVDHPIKSHTAFCAPQKLTMRPTSLRFQQFYKPLKALRSSWGIFATLVQATKYGVPLLCYQGSQKAGVQKFHSARHTFYRADPPKTIPTL
ncbi:hypothetical protein J6590_069081 [Homalodisca vitripennis]|nr:hypothetical protein J6590_069081 [Homalodisca vitripennis]